MFERAEGGNMATAQPTVSAREAESMQGRVGGQLLLASIIAQREKKGQPYDSSEIETVF